MQRILPASEKGDKRSVHSFRRTESSQKNPDCEQRELAMYNFENGSPGNTGSGNAASGNSGSGNAGSRKLPA